MTLCLAKAQSKMVSFKIINDDFNYLTYNNLVAKASNSFSFYMCDDNALFFTNNWRNINSKSYRDIDPFKSYDIPESSTTDDNCNILHGGRFYYLTEDDSVIVKVTIDKFTEYFKNGKYFIISKIKWVNNCEYNISIEKITLPNFPYSPGDIMNVKILKVEKNEIYALATVKGQSQKIKLVKIE